MILILYTLPGRRTTMVVMERMDSHAPPCRRCDGGSCIEPYNSSSQKLPCLKSQIWRCNQYGIRLKGLISSFSMAFWSRWSLRDTIDLHTGFTSGSRASSTLIRYSASEMRSKTSFPARYQRRSLHMQLVLACHITRYDRRSHILTGGSALDLPALDTSRSPVLSFYDKTTWSGED